MSKKAVAFMVVVYLIVFNGGAVWLTGLLYAPERQTQVHGYVTAPDSLDGLYVSQNSGNQATQTGYELQWAANTVQRTQYASNLQGGHDE